MSTLPLSQVAIDDGFWSPRQAVNRQRTIPHLFEQYRATGRLAALQPGWRPDPAGIAANAVTGANLMMFWDSDVFKGLEAACHALATRPDPALAAEVEALAAQIAACQQPDGYLNSWFRTVDPAGRFTNLRDWHELYNAGHLIEAAVAHHAATGGRLLLDVACRYADLIEATFGPGAGRRQGYCGHPEIELALIKLAEATAEPRYLALSRFFVDARGTQPHYFDAEAHARGERPEAFWAKTYEYNQSHRPVREQREVVGHAVRAMYLYSAMAELAAVDGDAGLRESCERLWQHLSGRRLYLTGGMGASQANEGFTRDYDLPNEHAYAETCAAIGLILWAWRMLQLGAASDGPDRRYADAMELALYNGALSGVSLDGAQFFYDNPLASDGGHRRRPWFPCPCCPPNIARLIASLGGYLYTLGDGELLVHLYVQSAAELTIGGQRVRLRQETGYPWDGAVRLRLSLERPLPLRIGLRLPGWCAAPQLRVNGAAAPLAGDTPAVVSPGGYVYLSQTWHDGDLIELDLPMPARRLYAHPAIGADRGRVALGRGPLIYCLEQADHEAPIGRIRLPDAAALAPRFEPGLLGGVVVLEGAAEAAHADGWGDALYRERPPETRPCRIRAVPYYAWGNREPGAMAVWITYR